MCWLPLRDPPWTCGREPFRRVWLEPKNGLDENTCEPPAVDVPEADDNVTVVGNVWW